MSLSKPKWCQKCGYVRKKEDTARDYACPKCGAVYAKVQSVAPAEVGDSLPTAATSSRYARVPSRNLKYLIASILATFVLGYLFLGTRSSRESAPLPIHREPLAKSTPPTAPTPEPVASNSDRYYDDALDYARDKVSVTLGEVTGTSVKATVVNQGLQELGSITVRVKGTGQWLASGPLMPGENVATDDYEVELVGGPFSSNATTIGTLVFPKGVMSLVFSTAPTTVRDAVINEGKATLRGVPIVKANF